MNNRELTYYTLAKPEKLKSIYWAADNTLPSKFSAKFAEKEAKHLWVKPNNIAFLKKLGFKIDFDKLGQFLGGQLLRYVSKFERSSKFISRKKWLKHTIFICKNEYNQTKLEIYNEAIKWIEDYQNNELEIYNLLNKEREPQKVVIEVGKSQSTIFKTRKDGATQFSKQDEERVLKVINSLNEYEFTNFLSEKDIDIHLIYELFLINSEKHFIPYSIALLNEIGFIKFLKENFKLNSQERDLILSKVLKTGKRRVKGNINVLNSYSKEDKTEYLSHLYEHTVKKDLEGPK